LIGDKIHFYCKNSKPSLRAQKEDSKAVGLSNVKQQLALLYQQEYTLEVTDNAENYVINLILTAK